jgi:hypothetical protein
MYRRCSVAEQLYSDTLICNGPTRAPADATLCRLSLGKACCRIGQLPARLSLAVVPPHPGRALAWERLVGRPLPLGNTMSTLMLRPMPSLYLIHLAAWAALVPAGGAHASPGGVSPPRDAVPAIARIAGAWVGRDTVERLEHRLGPGLHYTGQHPHGGRSWVSPSTHLWIDADGFDYNDRGRILNTIDLSLDDGQSADPHVPRIPARVRSRSLAFMGMVLPGMSRAQVLRLLRNRLPPPKAEASALTWEMRGWATIHPPRPDMRGTEYRVWDAQLRFRKDTLTDICVSCGY